MWITVRAVKLTWHTPKMSIQSQRFPLYSIYRLLVQFSFFLYLVHHVELEYIYIYIFAQDRILERNPCNVAFQQSRPCQITAWQAPVQHAYKVNFDGAVIIDEGLAGLGVVIRNDHGLIMASLTQQIPLPSSVIEVEVLAARKALELTIELGFDNITLEGDSKVLNKSLVKGDNFLAHYGHLLAEIHVLMARF